MYFKTDCSDVVKMIENQPESHSELDNFSVLRNTFYDFHITFIPCSLNVYVNYLTKARDFLFSHVSYLVLDWLSPRQLFPLIYINNIWSFKCKKEKKNSLCSS